MKNFCKLIGLLTLSCTFLTSAQAQVGSITTSSTSCSLTISSCEGDTLTLSPQNQASYANYKWYFGSVAPVNEITASTATASNVIATDFASNSPAIKVIANGGTYILTGEYATPAGCSATNDTFVLNFTPRPNANNATLTLCEKNAGSGVADFTLTNADATVTGGATGVAVTYYETLADARSAANPLSSPYNSGAKMLYARVENTTTGCYRTAALTLTVNPLPTVTDPTDQVVCNGANTTAVTFGGSAVSGTTFSWTNNTTSIGLAASGTGDIASFAATNAGSSPVTATITVTPTANSCPGTPQTFTIIVNPLPDFTLSKPVACPGTSEDVNISGLTNANTATAQLKLDAGTYAAYPSPATVTGLSVGSHTFTIKNENGCETAKSITISPVPARICLPVTVTRRIGSN